MLRMGVTAGLQQRRYIAFCISLLPITEKGVKKMIELVRYDAMASYLPNE